MPQPITLFEHEIYRGPTLQWSRREDAHLRRLRTAAHDDLIRPIWRDEQVTLQATQHVGVLRVGPHTIQVLPKMCRAPDSDPAQQHREATRNLLYLLSIALDVPVHEQELAPLLRQGTDWFEILTHLFTSHLQTEWQRGAHRGYQMIEDELPVLRGTWRIAEQLRRPAGGHRFSVAYDEFTADTQLNRVFRYVVEKLWRSSADANNRRRLGVLRQWMDEITLLTIVGVADASPRLITRLNTRFTPLLNLARLFLAQDALQLGSGDLTSFAFVFDMNVLFETFFASFLRRYRDQILPPLLADCELLPQTQGANRALARRGDQPVFWLRPDLAFRQGDTFPLLLDTKYKLLNTNDRKLGISSSDFYQMYAYAGRYACPRVLLLYPHTAGQTPLPVTSFTIPGADTIIAAATVDLQHDLGTADGRRMLMQELAAIIGGVLDAGDS